MEGNNQERSNNGIIRLTGDCGVQNARDVLRRLEQAMEEADQLELDLSGVEHSDAALMQIICAAHQSCVAQNKSITLLSCPSRPVLDTWRKGGFGQLCALSPEECLFKEVDVHEQDHHDRG